LVVQTNFILARPTNTLEKWKNLLVGPANSTLVWQNYVKVIVVAYLTAGDCNQYNTFGSATV
jgi:hypothetical protein